MLAESYEARLTQVANSAPGLPLENLLLELQESSEPAQGDPFIGVLAQALALWRLDRYEQAYNNLVSLETPLDADPRYWILRGMVSKQLPQGGAAALHAYRKAIILDSSRADLHYNLANLLRESLPVEASKSYIRSLTLDPNQPACWHNWGALMLNQQRLSEASVGLKNSLQLDPYAANVWCDLGNLFKERDELAAARRAFVHAISLDGLHGPSHVNLGAALVEGLQPDQALAVLQRGVQLESSSADSLWNLALAYLQLGEFELGWQLYESRFYLESTSRPTRFSVASIPASLEECPRLGDLPLLVSSEQGLGDSIQFSRYLYLLKAAGIPFEFRVPTVLLRLFREWTSCSFRVSDQALANDPEDSRAHLPLMSLPNLFRTSLETIPAALPYLTPPGPPPAHLHIPAPPGGLSVGLVWASDPANTAMYRRKSIPLRLLLPSLLRLVELDLIELHSLQCGEDALQLTPWQDHPRITNWAPTLHDFADTAHLVHQLDLVISVDTAVAHLSGALRRPTWVLLPNAADFRWLQQRDDSPWYPGTMRLFRQPDPGDWTSLVKQVQMAFDALFLLDLEGLASNTIAR